MMTLLKLRSRAKPAELQCKRYSGDGQKIWRYSLLLLLLVVIIVLIIAIIILVVTVLTSSIFAAATAAAAAISPVAANLSGSTSVTFNSRIPFGILVTIANGDQVLFTWPSTDIGNTLTVETRDPPRSNEP